jgi:hypothetical protein
LEEQGYRSIFFAEEDSTATRFHAQEIIMVFLAED